MKIKKLNKILNKEFLGKIKAQENDNSIILSGELSNWNDIIKACNMAVDKKSGKHVVNDIKLIGVEIPKMRLPEIVDNSLDGQTPDVLVIGGGISGASILRELSKWKLNTLLVEKESDLALQASSRNDGEVHPGIDLGKGSLKQHYVLLGNAMYEQVCKDLDVPFKRVGQYAGFVQGYLRPIVALFVLQRKIICKVPQTRIVGQKELREKEPNLSKKFKFAIYNESAGCVSPYNLTIAYGENAVQNGGKVSLNTAVLSMEVENDKIVKVVTNRGTVYPKIVINAAGVFAEDVAKMAKDNFYSIHPRKGTNSILDKKAGYIVNSIASIKKLGGTKHTKGGGLLHTVHDNILAGPNAIEIYEKENIATDAKSIAEVFNKQRQTNPDLTERDIITYFTGVRAPTFEEDFIIEKGRKTKNLIHCAGIQSPGLTTAPAVALDIEKMCIEMLREEMNIERNENFNPIRKGIPNLAEMSDENRNELIKKNPDYGVIVCRCEEISKGEIIDALNSPIFVNTVDGIKKRVRAGMGRCQGGFCSPIVTKIIAEYENKKLADVRKCENNSLIVYGETKGGENL